MRLLLAGLMSVVMFAAAPTPKDCTSCHEVDLVAFEASKHGGMGCVGCHSSITSLPHADKPKPVNCANCHEDQVKAYSKSVHGLAKQNGMADSATCQSCHGPVHKIQSGSQPTSPVNSKNLADTCGACHSNPDFLAKHKIPFAKPVEAYRLSVHGREVAKGNASAPSCSNCHGSHDILASKDPKARVNRANVADTCGVCHNDVQAVYADSVHGLAVKRGSNDSPTCTGCHGEHSILAPKEAGSLVNPARVSTVTCGRCHGDERMNSRYDFGDKVPAFQDSFHGLAIRGGQKTAANCASCHGVHNILRSEDIRSTINPANLQKTCGQCHPGLGEKISKGRVHVRTAGGAEHISVQWIRWAYYALIPMTIGFMLFHNGIDWLAKLRRHKPHHGTGEQLPRMNKLFRITHGMVMVSFGVLVITGFALKFPEAAWVQAIGLHGAGVARAILHRVAAVVISAATVIHFIHLALVKKDRVILIELLPGWQDAKDIANTLRYNLGLIDKRPTFGMFGYAEKMEYWAFMWGTVVMAVSGLLLWAQNWSLRRFPTWVLDAATAAHWYEAILATLSILVWHWYLVIFDPDVYPMDLAWLTGRASADHLRETRPEYYRQLMEKENPDSGSDAGGHSGH
ncbi:MAG: cytochrome b/b6 domain-containing protein [Geothrix sp.]|uniref:cytochrome b/b6 domain-containing protein n=1 Tax=Geothrix sp. TaxID=1962974 RepID=UPI0017DE3AFF|nr:cytochrome b/b6 domain-containing protein [Geothrix sp.]NWJ39362.1 cytochrome b/b6 domain-containing protein [Geothrix sp.]WIL19413.1 MAG: cytochrome c3 family protein [Geothrix sp.]